MYSSFHDTMLVAIQVSAFAFFIYLFHAAHQRKLARKHELSKQVLDKLDSKEFLELLHSPNGRRSIERLLGSSESPREWVTIALRRAIFLVLAGVTFIVVYGVTDFSGHEMFLVTGSLAVSVGIGYLLAAALTRRRARRDDADHSELPTP